MQHTVIAFFDTDSRAQQARDVLIATGLPSEAISLQARCEPTYATDASAVTEPPLSDEGLLASIERFFESLFASQPPHETAQYAEAVRRGAVMLSVDAATDDQCALVKATLERMGPIDIDARAATWRAPGGEAMRENSPLEELGIRRVAQARPGGFARSYPRETTPAHSPGEASSGESNSNNEQPPAQASSVPDEYLENEEDFRGKSRESDRS